MGDEIRNPGTEMNEATLEGVSGGLLNDPSGRAAQICNRCDRHKRNSCPGKVSELADYMRKHDLIDDERACPFHF